MNADLLTWIPRLVRALVDVHLMNQNSFLKPKLKPVLTKYSRFQFGQLYEYSSSLKTVDACFSCQDLDVVMTDGELNGTNRVVVDGVAADQECSVLLQLLDVSITWVLLEIKCRMPFS